MNAVRKSEPIINLEGFFGAKGVAIRMKGQRIKKAKDATVTPAKTMSLKEVRVMLGLSIESMADAIGTKKSTYWFWEQGKRNMPDTFTTRVQALVIKHSKDHPTATTNGHPEGGFPV